MAESTPAAGRFEFVVLAGARARQLLRGCTPRIDGPEKPAKLATLEVKGGQIRKVPAPVEE